MVTIVGSAICPLLLWKKAMLKMNRMLILEKAKYKMEPMLGRSKCQSLTCTQMHLSHKKGTLKISQGKNREGRPRIRGSNPAATPAIGGNFSQPLSTNSQNQSQPKQRRRPKGKNSVIRLPYQKKGPSGKDKAGPSKSNTHKSRDKGKQLVEEAPQVLEFAQLVAKMVHVNNMWEKAKESVHLFQVQDAV